MPYWQLYYHIVWGTKRRLPLITPEIEPVIHGFLRRKAADLGGTVFASNGMMDHVHMAVAIPPRISVAKFVGQIKGAASTQLNKSGLIEPVFRWQEEYGVFSFDRKRLPNFIAYVDQQKQHHADATMLKVLELMTERRLVNEPSSTYAVADDAWWTEMQALGEASIGPKP